MGIEDTKRKVGEAGGGREVLGTWWCVGAPVAS
jgi:hypothetical protein